ncbi:uncharacterized protein LOC118497998 [Phyllostomus discolor]|uniref:Uncharacterized protein LOC118497998 n=1 Tax=Phyllostomus discolor TaxID=89673 RepID=A0A7E6CTK0_9CHIR|nr:uncharacterized protein LOC118497998 [Phyllostomus discolor]
MALLTEVPEVLHFVLILADALFSPFRRPAERKTREPALGGTPLTHVPYPLRPRRLPPRIAAVGAGLDPVMGAWVPAGDRLPEARAAGGRAARAPGRGPGRDPTLLSGAGFLSFHPEFSSALPADSVLLGDHVTQAAFDPCLVSGSSELLFTRLDPRPSSSLSPRTPGKRQGQGPTQGKASSVGRREAEDLDLVSLQGKLHFLQEVFLLLPYGLQS